MLGSPLNNRIYNARPSYNSHLGACNIVENLVVELEKVMKANAWEKQAHSKVDPHHERAKDGANLALECGRLWKSIFKFFCYIGDIAVHY
jgi:hypothetical protein